MEHLQKFTFRSQSSSQFSFEFLHRKIKILIFLNTCTLGFWCNMQWTIARLIFWKDFVCFPKLCRWSEFFCEDILLPLNGISVLYWLSCCKPLWVCVGCLCSSVLVWLRRPVGILDEACCTRKYECSIHTLNECVKNIYCKAFCILKKKKRQILWFLFYVTVLLNRLENRKNMDPVKGS